MDALSPSPPLLPVLPEVCTMVVGAMVGIVGAMVGEMVGGGVAARALVNTGACVRFTTQTQGFVLCDSAGG